jgi:hypothetical protein
LFAFLKSDTVKKGGEIDRCRHEKERAMKQARGDILCNPEVMYRLMGLPHKILQYHEIDGLPQMILHELGHDTHFALDKAMYLIDNPDFDCAKGVAGYSRDECKFHRNDLWEAPDAFVADMHEATFHQQMKQFLRNGFRRKEHDFHDPDELVELGVSMGMKSPSFFTWRMKHGNHGVLIFEGHDFSHAHHKALLEHASALLSFC